MKRKTLLLSTVFIGFMLSGCDSSSKEKNSYESESSLKVEHTEVLPYLNIKEQPAKIALPYCEQKNCVEMDIQTIQTQDQWMNDWVEKSQAIVIQKQIGLDQNITLQQAVNAYVKKSDHWQTEVYSNPAYALNMYTRIAYQRNQFVLLQIGVDARQDGLNIKERYYFFVADRKSKKALKILDVIDSKKQSKMNTFVQEAYKSWLKKQSSDVQKKSPKKLLWGQADWFFDNEGLGLHYRTNEILDESEQLDIYLTKAQTQQVLKADIYQNMF